MLCITDIKVHEVNDNAQMVCQIRHFDKLKFFDYKDFDFDEMGVPVVKEWIKGEIFINERHEQVCIGMSKKVQQSIGLPFEVYGNMQNNFKIIQSQRDVDKKLIARLERKTIGYWWNRLKKRIKND